MLFLLILIFTTIASVIVTSSISNRSHKKHVREIFNTIDEAKTDAHMNGYRKGWEEGYDYGRHVERLERILEKDERDDQ